MGGPAERTPAPRLRPPLIKRRRSRRQTDTFLGDRYRRIARRRGSRKANVAIGRSILVIIWHPLSDPEARYADLSPDFYTSRIDPDRHKRNHVRQLEALGYTVILERAASLPAPEPHPAPLTLRRVLPRTHPGSYFRISWGYVGGCEDGDDEDEPGTVWA